MTLCEIKIIVFENIQLFNMYLCINLPKYKNLNKFIIIKGHDRGEHILRFFCFMCITINTIVYILFHIIQIWYFKSMVH